jgi:hypothetical protein
MKNEKLETLSNKVVTMAKIPPDENFGSVIAVIMVIGIMLSLIRILQECNKNKLSPNATSNDKYSLYGYEIKQFARKRGWFTKLRIKKVMRQQMPKDQYAKYSIPLLNALLEIGEKLTEEEIITLVEAAHV